MIIYKGTKTIGLQSFLIFENEIGGIVNIPVSEENKSLFIHYFDRLANTSGK